MFLVHMKSFYNQDKDRFQGSLLKCASI